MSSIFLSRNARLICQFPTAAGVKTFEIPILEGFSFSQATNTAEVTISEATRAGKSRRGRKMFNNSLAPVEFSFSTYARPFKSAGTGTGKAHNTAHTAVAVEAPLWAMLSAADTYDPASLQVFDRVAGSDGSEGNVITSTTAGDASTSATMTVDFARSDVPQLCTTAKLTFEIEEEDDGGVLKYELDEAVMNECTMDFDIEGIATLSWSGMAKSITEGSNATAIAPDVTEGSGIGGAKSAGFIQNRLSTVTVGGSGSGSILGAYNITLTGGSITISNNLTFLTPEEIGRVNTPIGHVTGTRTISGSLTCYLDHATAGSADLFEDLAASTNLINNSFDLGINIGGTTGPAVQFNADHANLQIPTHSFDDVVSVEITFDALPNALDDADDLTVVYTSPAASLT